MRILIIEDEAIIGMLLSDVLSSLGHTVTDLATTQDEAVASASRLPPDLLIADANLGEGNGSGLTAVDIILAAGCLPHIFVSGDSRNIHASRPDAVVMQKPFFEAELVRAIDRAVASAERQSAYRDGQAVNEVPKI